MTAAVRRGQRGRGGRRGRRGEPAEALVNRRLRECGVAATRPRRIIAGILLSREGHLGAGELHALARAADARVGLATVYRTLELLTRRGLAAELDFGDGWKRWERAAARHHDHIMCTRCGRIVEFDVPEIESLQGRVARSLGFAPSDHLMIIYGACEACRGSAAAPGARDG